MSYKIAQLLLTPANKYDNTAEIFISQPSAEKEELAGKLFVLIQIDSKKALDIKVANFLIENLNNNYYQNEKMILRERVKTVKVEHIFESALAKTNKTLFDYLRMEKIKFNFSKFSATVGIIYNNDINFANIGKNKTFLIYKNKDSANKEKYFLTDISKQKDQFSQNQNSPKLFSTVISGTIPKFGYFFITNEALPEYVSNKQIIDVITNLPPASAAQQIKNELSKIKHYVPFLGIIIKNTSGSEKEFILPEKTIASTNESISKLNIVEEKTEKLLMPGGYINLKKWLGLFFGKTFKTAAKNMPGGDKIIREKIFFKSKKNLRLLNGFWQIIKNSLLYTAGIFIYIFKLFTDKNKIIGLFAKIKSIPFFLKTKIINSISWFKGLSKKNKIIIALGLLFIILFAQGVILSNSKNKKAVKEENISNVTASLDQKLNQAEASLLYNNEEGAKNILIEISALLNQLPRQTDDEKNQYQIYEKKYTTFAGKIRHIALIDNPRELADFSKLNQAANPENIIIPPAANKIYSGDSSQKTIYSLDLKDKTATSINKNMPDIKSLLFPSISTDGNITFFNADSIIQLNPKKDELSSTSVKLTGAKENIVAASIYNNKLYALDKKDGQVYSYKKTSAGFTDAASWIKDKIEYSEARHMFIDGKIYILTSKGEITRYLKGKRENFTLDTVDPPIENAKKFLISQTLKYIYISEPDKQRVIIFDADGKFVMQYQSDKFNDLRDFQVDEKKKLIYILNGNIVYEFDAAHLK